jgi:hypothetical protein
MNSASYWPVSSTFVQSLCFEAEERERERVRKEEKRKHLGESERCFISEGEKRASC